MCRIVNMVWAFLIAGTLVAPANGVTFRNPQLQSAWQYYTRQNISRAQELLHHTPATTPEGPLLHALCDIAGGNAYRLHDAYRILDSLKNRCESPLYFFAWGMFWKKKRVWSSAITDFKRAIDVNPLFTEAYVELGDAYLEQMLQYRDRYTADEIPLSFETFAREDARAARNAFLRALQLNPTHRTALFKLGLLYYEEGKIDSMLSLFQQAQQWDPEGVNFWLFCGLGYQEKGEYRQAARFFQQALALMDEHQRRLMSNPKILNNHFVRLVENVDSATFWARQDPLYLTEENEFHQEFMARLAYVNLRFGVPALHLEGWETERGQAYLFFGKPLRIIRYGKTFEGKSILAPAELWIYKDFSLMFEDVFWNGNFRLANPELQTTGVSAFKSRSPVDFTVVARSAYATHKSVFELTMPGGKLDVKGYFASFLNPVRNVPEIFVAVEVPFRSFQALDSLNLKIGFYQRDSLPQPLFIGEVDPLQYQQHYVPRERRFLYAFNVPVKTTRFAYSLEIMETVHQQATIVRDSLNLPSPNVKQFAMSDVVLAKSITTKPGGGIPFRRGLYIIPAFQYKFSRKNPINLYFELYNLTQTSDNKATYVVENSLVPVRRGLLRRLLGSLAGTVTVVNEYEVYAKHDVVLQQLNVERLPEGDYRLIIRVTDAVSGQTIQREVLVRIE